MFGPALGWLLVAAAGLIATGRDPGAWGAVDRRGSGLAGSEACAVCHPAEVASWRRSFHRTMTRPASGDAVLAPFAGEQLVSQGFRATMTRSGAGLPHVKVEAVDGGVLLDLDVALTVGSHRYQQYVARVDRGGGPGELWRLPVAWHLGERRWIPMNAAFLEPEGEPGDDEDFLRHLSRWNDNCILCHNTEPVPGLLDRSHGAGPSGQFASRVGEFGIACEACHGPAAAHVARQADPARRLLAGGGDPAIAHPGRLTPGDESGLCGRCHGNRIAADVGEVLRSGDGFLPGEPLASVSRPIFADSHVGGSEETPFAARFWPDGTPRLSAYEYQGLLQSPCFKQGEPGGMGCNHCHDMHGDEPDMQVRAGRKGQAACDGCHALDASHGGHRRGTVDCQGCHMPRVTYGLLEGMISHRVSSPDPGAWVGRHDQPDACTQCHVDRSRRWAAEQLPRLGLRGGPSAAEAEEEGWGPRVLLDLHGGDPVQRGLAAHALARAEVPVPAATRLAWLVDGLEDGYPAVRWMAWRAMQRLADPELARLLAGYDPHADVTLRVPAVDALRARLGPGPLTEAQRLALEARQDATLLSIGE